MDLYTSIAVVAVLLLFASLVLYCALKRSLMRSIQNIV